MDDKDYEAFLRMNLSPYQGEGVAICGEKVICHGKNFNNVFNSAKKSALGWTPFLSMVPGK